jgi:DNA polymerase III gamma/tau subunit
VWEIARAPQPRLALEMTLLKALHLAPAGSIPDLISPRRETRLGAAANWPERPEVAPAFDALSRLSHTPLRLKPSRPASSLRPAATSGCSPPREVPRAARRASVLHPK